MSMSSLFPAEYVTSDTRLQRLVDTARQENLIALDTESNSLYAYQGRVCLIQLSTRQRDFIIDPFKIDDLSPLGEILRDPTIEKVFHAAEYDLICLKRDFDFDIVNLFDTMYAARMLRFKAFGLGDLLAHFFNVTVDKSHQRDDWGRRPLPIESLLYAQMDTHYLPELRDRLREQLVENDRMAEAQEVFRDVSQFEVKEKAFDPDGFWRLGRPHGLNRREMAFLRELYIERERLAQEADCPPYRIISNTAMINIAVEQPRNFRELSDVRGMGNQQVRLFGDALLTALERGYDNHVGDPPRPDRPDPVIAERYIALHAWRKSRAQDRNLESSLVLSKQTLWDIAHMMPTTRAELALIEGIGRWRLDAYGDELLELITQLK